MQPLKGSTAVPPCRTTTLILTLPGSTKPVQRVCPGRAYSLSIVFGGKQVLPVESGSIGSITNAAKQPASPAVGKAPPAASMEQQLQQLMQAWMLQQLAQQLAPGGMSPPGVAPASVGPLLPPGFQPPGVGMPPGMLQAPGGQQPGRGGPPDMLPPPGGDQTPGMGGPPGMLPPPGLDQQPGGGMTPPMQPQPDLAAALAAQQQHMQAMVDHERNVWQQNILLVAENERNATQADLQQLHDQMRRQQELIRQMEEQLRWQQQQGSPAATLPAGIPIPQNTTPTASLSQPGAVTPTNVQATASIAQPQPSSATLANGPATASIAQPQTGGATPANGPATAISAQPQAGNVTVTVAGTRYTGSVEQLQVQVRGFSNASTCITVLTVHALLAAGTGAAQIVCVRALSTCMQQRPHRLTALPPSTAMQLMQQLGWARLLNLTGINNATNATNTNSSSGSGGLLGQRLGVPTWADVFSRLQGRRLQHADHPPAAPMVQGPPAGKGSGSRWAFVTLEQAAWKSPSNATW